MEFLWISFLDRLGMIIYFCPCNLKQTVVTACYILLLQNLCFAVTIMNADIYDKNEFWQDKVCLYFFDNVS